MKLRFFGDSWYWSWFFNVSWKSKEINSLIFNKFGFPSLEIYLNHLGIECEHFNFPGKSFYTTTMDVISLVKANPTVDYNIIFFSNLIRFSSFVKEELPLPFDVSNYDNFMYKWKSDVKNLLIKLDKWANSKNQNIIILGGHCTLPKEVFDSANLGPRVNLLTECVTTTILKEYFSYNGLKSNFGLFGLSKDFSNNVNEQWDPKLVNQIYEDQEYWDTHITNLKIFYPDFCHLNAVSHVCLADLLLYKISKLKGEI